MNNTISPTNEEQKTSLPRKSNEKKETLFLLETNFKSS